MGSHRPADHFAAASVEDEGEVEETFPSRQVRYVGQPQAIRGGGEKAAIHQVGRGSAIPVAAGGRSPSPAHATVEAGLAHQSSHSPSAAPHAQSLEFGVYPWIAVGAARTLMDLPDPFGEGRILQRASRWRPLPPGIVARAGDAQHPAQQRDGITGLLHVDELKEVYRIPSFRAKKAVAFLKISLSWRRTLFSRLSLASSSRSSVESPSRSPSSISFCFLQFLKVCSETSSSREICANGFPEERINLMASSLNSGGYGGLVGGTRTTPFRESSSYSLQVST